MFLSSVKQIFLTQKLSSHICCALVWPTLTEDLFAFLSRLAGCLRGRRSWVNISAIYRPGCWAGWRAQCRAPTRSTNSSRPERRWWTTPTSTCPPPTWSSPRICMCLPGRPASQALPDGVPLDGGADHLSSAMWDWWRSSEEKRVSGKNLVVFCWMHWNLKSWCALWRRYYLLLKFEWWISDWMLRMWLLANPNII